MTANSITDALRANVANAKSKAGRLLAEEELARWLARKESKPFTPSPFSRFVDALANTPDNPSPYRSGSSPARDTKEPPWCASSRGVAATVGATYHARPWCQAVR